VGGSEDFRHATWGQFEIVAKKALSSPPGGTTTYNNLSQNYKFQIVCSSGGFLLFFL
jgi:hypothetical protein